MIEDHDLDSCPEPVANYLRKVGVLGKSRKTFAHIFHGGEFRLKPKQKWFPITGEYKFHPELPSFDWKASIKIFPLLFITVRDQYKDGVGRSLVKFESLYPLADQTGPETTESSLGRLLVELVLIPTALVPSERIRWEVIDAQRARIVLKSRNFEVSAIFEFDDSGLPIKTSIDRFGIFDGQIKKKSFVCDLSQFQSFEGLLIPSEIYGSWDFKTEQFCWLHFKITSVHYE